IVSASAALLADRVGHYTFISSISVYAGQGTDEDSPPGRLDDESVEQVTGQTYGPLKALCEQAAEHVMPGRVLNVRAGVIVGPHDPTDRFTYWVQRVARGGEVLAPGRPDRPVQFVDVRDLARWIVRAVEARVTGVYNATGPRVPLAIGHLLDAIRRVSGSDARLTWVDEGFLTDAGVTPWTEVPLWIPQSNPSASAMLSVNSLKAIVAGLTYRPLADTIRDTLAWDVTRPSDSERRAGLKPEREAELLKVWRERAGR
ncbi:MAG: NAD-dependent epimerase/dehydratase family protein, partial [Armatimonadota bacterium]